MPMMPPKHRPLGWQPSSRSGSRDKFYQSPEWRALRSFVLRRDRGICARCGLSGSTFVHHRVERRDGGSDHPDNLEAMHKRCHAALHAAKGIRHD